MKQYEVRTTYHPPIIIWLPLLHHVTVPAHETREVVEKVEPEREHWGPAWNVIGTVAAIIGALFVLGLLFCLAKP